MRRLLGLGLKGLVGALLLVTMWQAPPVHADIYGAGNYSACKYEVGCPSQQHTTVQTTSGLDVAINLTDGQKIPANGYTIMVTPLNGQGRSFQKVEFYVNGNLAGTFYPDTTGTATWLWDTKTQGLGDKDLKIIVYDTNGSTVTKMFHVTIVAESTSPSAGSTVNPPTVTGNTQGMPATSTGSNPITQLLTFLQTTIRAIPTPIAVGIPYLLLLILLAIILLLYLQSRREAVEIQHRALALERARQLVEEKEGFIQLASHYLRTPLTLIKGGVDFLRAGQPATDPAFLNNMTVAVDDFGAAVEGTLTRAGQDAGLRAITIPPEPVTKMSTIWLAPMFWLPTAITGVVLIMLNYLFVQSGKLDFSFMSVAAQFSLYAAMIVALYVVVRWQQLHIRDARRTERQEAEQAAIDEARNQLIRDASATLAQKLDAIRAYISQTADGRAKTFMTDGYTRIAEVLKRFRATATVIPPVTSMPYVRFSLSALINQAEAHVVEAANAKHISIESGTNDVQLATPQPSWIVQVLTTLLDNAIAYSPENAKVEVGGDTDGKTAHVYVRDHGSGIPFQKMAELFKPFSKAEGAINFDHPGIGLSLYLDRLLISSLGGSIKIEPNEGGGTAVFVSFPVR